MSMIVKLPHPSHREWSARQGWFDARLPDVDAAPLRLDEQARALLSELRLAFCAGAWASTVILAQTALDAAMADSEAYEGPDLNELRFGRDYVWLRNRRNDLVHNDKPVPTLTTDDLTRDTAQLEAEARRAVSLVLKGLMG
jgi:hypothetical protein